jgi:hypothetical protein
LVDSFNGRELFDIDLTRAVAGLSQFIGQGHRKAASVSGRNHFKPICVPLLNVAAGGIGGFIQGTTRCADGAFATLMSAQPKD